jgi:molybdopterin molybdotransferase
VAPPRFRTGFYLKRNYEVTYKGLDKKVKEFFKVLDIEQVLGLRHLFQKTSSEEIHLENAAGRILAEDMLACENLPGFARSTVDGYAVRAASTFGASESNPALLSLVGTVAMGDEFRMSVAFGQAVRISTGGMLPPGADGVVMLEHSDTLDHTTIEVFRSVAPGQHIIAADEDYPNGALVLPAGRRLRPQDIGVLAAFGRTRIGVIRQPRVAIISTGDEIVAAEDTPAPAQIRDVNRYTLAGLVSQAGGVPMAFGIVRDQFQELRAACERALEQCEMVLISGGSSVGARDFSLETISAFSQAELMVHGIAISPGKPTILAKVFGKPLWGLPGHVTSAMIVFTRVVRPFLMHIAGLAACEGEDVRLPARLTRNVASAQGRTDFIRVRLLRQVDEWLAEPILGKSGLINTMVISDGLIEIGKNIEGLDAGAPVEVMLF